MKLILSHPTGNAFVRAAANGFYKTGLLQEFHTSIACFPGSILDKIAGLSPLAEIRRRIYDPQLKEITKTSPFREAGRIISSKTHLTHFTRHELGIFSIDAVYRNLDKKVASRIRSLTHDGLKGVYAYEDCALASFTEAKCAGISCFYDLPIGYWRTARKLLQAEGVIRPEWAQTIVGLQDSAEKLNRKDKEIMLSDTIIVASQFTANTLQDFPGVLPPVVVVPYAFPTASLAKDFTKIKPGTRLKLLFVGSLSQRKGIANLFEAIKPLSRHVELTIVGLKTTKECAILNTELASHKWIPTLPHEKILALMRTHDVLIFPSLFEGFGLVITEAMSQGTPVITTDRTAGPDFITNGQNGWIVEAGSTNALRETIEGLLQKPDAIAEIGYEAWSTAKKRTWADYEDDLVAVVNKTNAAKIDKAACL